MSIEHVDWFDPRAVAQRDAMHAETGAMYERFMNGHPPEVRAGIDEALAVDPDEIIVTLLALEGDEVLGHASLRAAPSFGDGVLEVKKVFVGAPHRGRGVSRVLMSELERIALERGAASLVLQTGELQVPAIRLYENIGYRPIPPYGKYVAVPGALCYRKALQRVDGA